MKSVFNLVTGGTGFVGQRLTTLLSKRGHSIRVLSRHQHKDYDTVISDLGSEEIPLSALEFVDTVFHLAGYAHDPRDASGIEHLYQAVNVNATIQLAELAVKNGVKQFVFVSSVKAGGLAVDGQCMTEEDQGKPDGVYGRTKREAELKLLEIGSQSGMQVSIIRSPLVYGPNVKGNLQMMLSGIEKGWFPPLPETGNRRSMIHVDDLVRALLLVVDDHHANGEIYIATDGVPHSAGEIYVTMCNVIGKSVPKWSVPKYLFEIAASMNSFVQHKVEKLFADDYYSSEKLQSIGFKAQRSLREMNQTSF